MLRRHGFHRLQHRERRLFPHPLRRAGGEAVSEGHRDFVRIAVAGRCEDFCVPCAVCRQVLYEFAPDMEVISLNGKGEELSRTLRELLPHGFGPEYLLKEE